MDAERTVKTRERLLAGYGGEPFLFNPSEPIVEAIEGAGRRIGPIEFSQRNRSWGADRLSVTIEPESVMIVVDGHTYPIWEEQLRELTAGSDANPKSPAWIQLDPRVGVIITHLSGHRDEHVHVTNASLWLLLRDDSQ